MELEHNFTVAAPVEQAWEALLDLERIAPCMPGATLTSHEGDEFTGNVRVKLGPVTMTFSGQGRFVERDPDARRIVVEAAGKDKRGGGTARAAITASLRPDGAGTAVAVHSDLVVTGRVAQFGRGMIADVSTRLLGQFTDCLSGKLGAAPAAVSGPEAAVSGPEAAVSGPEAAASGPEAAASGAAAGSASNGAPAGTEAAPTGPAGLPPAVPEPATAPIRPPSAAGAPPASDPAPPPARASEPPPKAQPPAQAEPIDLLGVTGIRAAAGRLVPYLLVFVLGGLVGGGLVALLVR